MHKDQRKPLMIHPCYPSPPHSLMGPQLPSYFLQKSQQQRRFQGSLISLACPNCSEAGHKDKIHQPAVKSGRKYDWLHDSFSSDYKEHVCMHAKTHQPQNEITFEKWFHYSLSRVRPRSLPPTLQEAHSTWYHHRFPPLHGKQHCLYFTEKARPRCSYDIITHPTHSQARIPFAHTLRSSFQHASLPPPTSLKPFLAEFVNFLIWRGRTGAGT